MVDTSDLSGQGGGHDAEQAQQYPPGLRRKLVELARSGRLPEEMARELSFRLRRFVAGSGRPSSTS